MVSTVVAKVNLGLFAQDIIIICKELNSRIRLRIKNIVIDIAQCKRDERIHSHPLQQLRPRSRQKINITLLLTEAQLAS